MELPSIKHLELLAEVDTLLEEIRVWVERAPDWPAARGCQALVRRLMDRADALRVRLHAPLIVATLGGTGTGKSSLVNALVGEEVTAAGRQRPTTRQPTLICRGGLTPEELGIDPAEVHLVQRDVPALRDLVLLDCPDPDTTEGEAEAGTNLARLRHLLPHCDVLIVTSTQQKYRSARVMSELASAAPGARLVFVQTHADTDEDIRHDWRRQLAEEYAVGEMFFVDSLAAISDQREGLEPRGEFARLQDLLTRELAGAASTRIRRANFLDLVEQALTACRSRIDAGMPAIEALETALATERRKLATKLSRAMRDELLTSRGQWESRLMGEVVTRWGFSPFSLVLRIWQSVGSLLSGATLWRLRTPAQFALWGAFEGGRAIRRRQLARHADAAAERAVAFSWDEGELRAAAITLEGYVAEAGLPRDDLRPDRFAQQASQAGADFVQAAGSELQELIKRQASRHTGWFTRCRYEFALALMLGVILYRMARTFFYDWFAFEFGWSTIPPQEMSTSFLVHAVFWLAAWCLLLVWAFSTRLRRGLNKEVRQLAEHWSTTTPAGMFTPLEDRIRGVHHFSEDLLRLEGHIARFRREVAQPEPQLGQRIA